MGLLMVTKKGCPDCSSAKNVLTLKDITYEELSYTPEMEPLLKLLGWKGKVPFVIYSVEEPNLLALPKIAKLAELEGIDSLITA